MAEKACHICFHYACRLNSGVRPLMKAFPVAGFLKPILGLALALPVLASGSWLMQQQQFVVSSGSRTPSQAHPAALPIKGRILYVSEAQALAYRRSEQLWHAGFVYIFGVGLVLLIVKRYRS